MLAQGNSLMIGRRDARQTLTTPQQFSTIVQTTELSIVQLIGNVIKSTRIRRRRRTIEVMTTLNTVSLLSGKRYGIVYNPPSRKKNMMKTFCVMVMLSCKTCGTGSRTRTKSATMFGTDVPKKKPFKLTHLTPGLAFATGSQAASTGTHCSIATMN